MGYRHTNLHLLHKVTAKIPAVSGSTGAIPIMLPPVSINLCRLESALTQMVSAETAGNCRKLFDNYVTNLDWRGGNPLFYTVLRVIVIVF